MAFLAAMIGSLSALWTRLKSSASCTAWPSLLALMYRFLRWRQVRLSWAISGVHQYRDCLLGWCDMRDIEALQLRIMRCIVSLARVIASLLVCGSKVSTNFCKNVALDWGTLPTTQRRFWQSHLLYLEISKQRISKLSIIFYYCRNYYMLQYSHACKYLIVLHKRKKKRKKTRFTYNLS